MRRTIEIPRGMDEPAGRGTPCGALPRLEQRQQPGAGATRMMVSHVSQLEMAADALLRDSSPDSEQAFRSLIQSPYPVAHYLALRNAPIRKHPESAGACRGTAGSVGQVGRHNRILLGLRGTGPQSRGVGDARSGQARIRPASRCSTRPARDGFRLSRRQGAGPTRRSHRTVGRTAPADERQHLAAPVRSPVWSKHMHPASRNCCENCSWGINPPSCATKPRSACGNWHRRV